MLHILVLTDRDWTHPQGGGTGTNLYGQIDRWLAWGHRVTVIAGSYPGAERIERPREGLELHHMGTRLTVFARAAWATWCGLGREADVVLEVVNGIAFFTPLWRWLRAPRVVLCHHVHRDHYIAELGLRGRIAHLLLERLPLRRLYTGTPVLTISEAARRDLEELGVPARAIHVAYLGVDMPPPSAAHRSKALTPTLLYLGRLKRYKRIEVVLDVLAAIPEATLDIAGDGDHREALEQEIAQRRLADRVTMHGHVDERRKAALYARAWVSLTASSAEGWGLSVMEAASLGTTSAALRVGGLEESIVDGVTGILADSPRDLALQVAALVRDPTRRAALERAARERAQQMSWERTAEANLAVLEGAVAAAAPRRTTRGADRGDSATDAAVGAGAGGAGAGGGGGTWRVARRMPALSSDTLKAGGLALATLANNAVQLAFTIVFSRLLGTGGYGSLASLISAFLVLLVGGQALQVAAAREVAGGALRDPAVLAASVRSWTRWLLAIGAVAIVAGAAARVPLAALLGVPHSPWAAGAIPVTGVAWLLLSLQRGVLQGLRRYRAVGVSIVGEAIARLAIALVLVLAGAGVTGAFLGTPLSFALVALPLGAHLAAGTAERYRGAPLQLHWLVSGAWAPIAGLGLLALLQNVDVIVGRHQLSAAHAGSYAAAAVAAKTVVWIASGAALYLLPEAARRAAAGSDPRPVLARALTLLLVIAVPLLAGFVLLAHPVMRIAFTSHYEAGAAALPALAGAMTLLAVAYLTVQYMLALGRLSFLWVLGVVAIAEPFLLSAGHFSLFAYASVVLGLQLIAASVVLALGWRARVPA